MATIYKHRRSDLASQPPPSGVENIGELTINLAKAKAQTVRQLTTATFVGTIESETLLGTDLIEIRLVANIAVALADNAVIAVRSTNLATGVTSPNINTASVNQAHAIDSDTFTVDGIEGRALAVGDFIWLLDGVTTEEVVTISGHSTASAYPPAEPEVGDIWVNISVVPPVVNILGVDGEFEELVTGGGDTDFEGANLKLSTTTDMDFGEITTLGKNMNNEDRNTALAVTYSAVEYDFGGVRSPRAGPDFGDI